MSADPAHRFWRQAGLQVLRGRPRRGIASAPPRLLPPATANYVWAYDFVFDRGANGQQLKCSAIVDKWTSECLAVEVSGSIGSRHVIEVLTRRVSTYGAPRHLRSDNGPELVSRAMLKWLTKSGIDTAFIYPEKPWQNATNGSFNDNFRAECFSFFMVQKSGSGEGPDRELTETLQRGSTTFESPLSAPPQGIHKQRSHPPVISGPRNQAR